MLIRLHFLHEGQRLEPHGVASRSPNVYAQMREGCAELTLLPHDAGPWTRRATIARVRHHRPLAEQLEAFAALVNEAQPGAGAPASRVADRNAALLAQAQELASSIGDAMLATADAGLRGLKREVGDDIEAARTAIRRHPLRSIGIAAAVSALLTAISRRRRR